MHRLKIFGEVELRVVQVENLYFNKILFLVLILYIYVEEIDFSFNDYSIHKASHDSFLPFEITHDDL